MGQGSNAAAGRPVFLAFGDIEAARRALADTGWLLRAGTSDERPPIVLADLRGSDTLPADWRTTAGAVARRGGALVVVGTPALLAAALRSGATHGAPDASPQALALVLASAAVHVDRVGEALGAAGGVLKTASSGWAGPAAALAQVDEVLAGRPDSPALLVVLERFEVVNAAYGRSAGDQVLDRAARRIALEAGAGLGAGVLVARVGGSEFLVLPRSPGPLPASVVTAVTERLAEPFAVAGGPVTVGHRIATTQALPAETGAALLDRLREQVQAARADEPPVSEESPDFLAVDLHHAIERDEIELLFQPQVALASGRITGVEALARWAHPRLGTLGAEPLLAAAARAGLAGSLSAHIQMLALRSAAAWSGRLATLRLAMNVTAQDVAAPGFADHLLARLAATGFPADRLTVELTETGLILDLDLAAAALAVLRRAGCRVALDDFGTGYSSLAYLKALPVDYLKIDRAITRDVTGSARDRAVLDGIVGIAGTLGLATIVEGVETAEQRDRLADLGCDLYQGFLCAEPVDADALGRLLEAW